MKKFVTKSASETGEVAAQLGAEISSGAVIAFTGDLGAGKTTFIKKMLEEAFPEVDFILSTADVNPFKCL